HHSTERRLRVKVWLAFPDDSHRIGVPSALRRRPARDRPRMREPREAYCPPDQRRIKSNIRLSRRCNIGKKCCTPSRKKSNKRLQKRYATAGSNSGGRRPLPNKG